MKYSIIPAFITLLMISVACQTEKTEQQPNVILIMADDMGYNVFEKHMVLAAMEGPDIGPWCCTPVELKQYFYDIKTAEKML
ncbi:hypothetical protein LCGC14_1512190, partial [marine sediment metagenome]